MKTVLPEFRVSDAQASAVHRASWISEAVNYRGFSEEYASKAYDQRQAWMNDETATSLRQDRRDAQRDHDWDLAYIASHIHEAVRLGIVAPVESK